MEDEEKKLFWNPTLNNDAGELTNFGIFSIVILSLSVINEMIKNIKHK